MIKRLLLLTISILLSCLAFAQHINGSWFGVLNLGGRGLPLVVNINEVDGAYVATMDSPSQGAKGIPVTTLSFENDSLSFTISGIGAEYKGVLAGDSIAGTFKQRGMAFPLTFTRMEPDPRLQDPVIPYPYHSENVVFENKKAGIKLAGTLTQPKDGKRFPAVVLVSGSGPQNRNEELFDHRPFLILSDYLTNNGIAVLRYDDRGVGESEGNYKTATLEDFATDAAAAVAYLKSRKEINAMKTGVIGHSEGGTIAFMLAAEKSNKLSFIISMAGMAIRGDSLLKMQRYLIAKEQGISDDKIADNEDLITAISNLLDKYPPDFILKHIDSLSFIVLPEHWRENKEMKLAAQQGIKQMMSPELQSLMNYDPSVVLQKIHCPVLALGGDKDLQVPAKVNLERIKTLAKGRVSIKEYPGLNHLFQHCETGLINEYGTIEETISPEVLEDIVAWIKEVI